MDTAREQFLFGEIQTTGVRGVSLAFLAGRLCAGRLTSTPHQRTDHESVAVTRERILLALEHVVRGDGGRFYRCLPLAGVTPKELASNFDGLELLEEAIERVDAADRRRETASNPFAAASPLPAKPSGHHVNPAGRVSTHGPGAIAPEATDDGPTSGPRTCRVRGGEFDPTATNAAYFASRASAVRASLDRERTDEPTIELRDLATVEPVVVLTEPTVAEPVAADASVDAVVDVMDVDATGSRRGALRRLIRSLAG